jgi:hypothetical protein
MQAQNFKFLNKSPMILGFEFFDCIQAVSLSLVTFAISGSHFLALVTGFGVVLIKSAYKRLYPKNTVFFWKNKKDGVAIKWLINEKVKNEEHL